MIDVQELHSLKDFINEVKEWQEQENQLGTMVNANEITRSRDIRKACTYISLYQAILHKHREYTQLKNMVVTLLMGSLYSLWLKGDTYPSTNMSHEITKYLG